MKNDGSNNYHLVSFTGEFLFLLGLVIGYDKSTGLLKSTPFLFKIVLISGK